MAGLKRWLNLLVWVLLQRVRTLPFWVGKQRVRTVRQVADRVWFLDEGRVVEEGPPAALGDASARYRVSSRKLESAA